MATNSPGVSTSSSNLVGEMVVTSQSKSDSRRARLSPYNNPNAQNLIYGTSGLLQPLRATGGMVWPYQPSITWDQGVTYNSMEMTHTNQEFLAYVRSNAPKFTVQGKFTVQNQEQGIYALASIHLMRVVTKMYFGETDPLAGTPPPKLLFSAYGTYMFNALPVLITNFTVTLPDDVDYVPVSTEVSLAPDVASIQKVPGLNFNLNNAVNNLNGSKNLTNGTYAWLPAVFDLSCSMTVQNNPSNLRTNFNLDEFRSGSLLKGGGWS